MRADFTITIEFDRPRTVRVVVHDDLRALRSAATRYDKSWGRGGKNGETLGICHRFERLHPDNSIDPMCAIVRLAAPNLGVGVVSHELAHAAVWLRELEEGGEEPLTCENDESFCWVLGELVRQTVSQLYERGVYA